VLTTWIEQAQDKTGLAVGRLGWLVASSVVIAALQRSLHADGAPRFLLKGGAYLEVRLGLNARATGDIDTLFRGDFDEFLTSLDETLRDPWGPVEFRRSEIEVMENTRRIVKPRRFRVQLLIRGSIWRAIKVEAAPDEGSAGAHFEALPGTSLTHFGLPSSHEPAGIVLNYQVAQKLHACTDPHQPPNLSNDRPRDLVDLLLIREAFYGPDADLASLRIACEDIFTSRAAELQHLGFEPREWPPTVIAHDHWDADYGRAAGDVDFPLTLAEAVDAVNAWVAEIAAA